MEVLPFGTGAGGALFNIHSTTYPILLQRASLRAATCRGEQQIFFEWLQAIVMSLWLGEEKVWKIQIRGFFKKRETSKPTLLLPYGFVMQKLSHIFFQETFNFPLHRNNALLFKVGLHNLKKSR